MRTTFRPFRFHHRVLAPLRGARDVGPGLDSVRLASAPGPHSASTSPLPPVSERRFLPQYFSSLFDFAVVAPQSACTCVAHVHPVRFSLVRFEAVFLFLFLFFSVFIFLFFLSSSSSRFATCCSCSSYPSHVRPFCSFVRRYQFNSIQLSTLTPRTSLFLFFSFSSLTPLQALSPSSPVHSVSPAFFTLFVRTFTLLFLVSSRSRPPIASSAPSSVTFVASLRLILACFFIFPCPFPFSF